MSQDKAGAYPIVVNVERRDEGWVGKAELFGLSVFATGSARAISQASDLEQLKSRMLEAISMMLNRIVEPAELSFRFA